MENYLSQLVLGYNSETSVRSVSQWEGIRRLRRESMYKGSNSPLEQLQGISALSEQQMHCQGYGKRVYLIFALTNYYLYGRNAEVSWDQGPAVWSDVQALL